MPPAMERQPLFIGSDLSWISVNQLVDASNMSDIEAVMSPGIGVFDNPLASYPEITTTPYSQNSLLQLAEEALSDQMCGTNPGLELTDEPPQQASQERPRLTPYHDMLSPQGMDKVIRQVYCNCLHAMTQLLEDTESTAEGQGVDEFLMYLGRGTKMCSSVLACVHCNACIDNSMLLTSNAQQLVSTAQKISSKLLLTHQAGRRRSDGFKWEMRDDLITFGRYRIEQPEMRNGLVYHMIFLHIQDLQQLLAKIKKGVGLKRRAEELLAEAESDVAKLSRVIRELAK